MIVDDRKMARVGQLAIDRQQRLDLVRQVVLINLAWPGGQLDEQVHTGLPVAPDKQPVTRMLLGRMPAAIRPEPPDGREPIERGFRAIEINKIKVAGQHRLRRIPLSPETAG